MTPEHAAPVPARTTPAAVPAPPMLTRLITSLTPAPISDLPARVIAQIRAREDEAEVLVRILQLIIVTIFASLYAVAPKPGGGMMMQVFTPTAISLYFAVTVFGLAWSLRTRLPDWAVYWSSIMDMGLLFAMIWSFHLQYHQPAAFYLKAPTLLYVFIFIALRALRFQARFVIAAGVAGAVGWIGMVIYAVAIEPEQSVITRDYAAYLTSNLVLIGGEIDKVVSILMVTAILAVAILRARRSLVQAATEGAAAQDLSRFFDASVASKIRASGDETALGRGVMRTVAILNVDLRGFTRLAATLPAPEVMAILAEYQARFVAIIRAHGGAIDKFLGDGIMATFGAVETDEGAAACALAALEDIVAESKAWMAEREAAGLPQLVTNAAVAAGPTVCGVVGHGSRLEYTVIGPSVNLSAKLEKYNKTLGTLALTNAETLALAKPAGFTPKTPPRMVECTVDGIAGQHRLAVIGE
ncbi:Adenylate cyclase [hydrothermal vent metagenome]|uniref:Adenylate cyclase n=1 Tax=hydrothermal vent metagenome TaxID=652676 RepID=A0A3B0TC68_9ZZZZ